MRNASGSQRHDGLALSRPSLLAPPSVLLPSSPGVPECRLRLKRRYSYCARTWLATEQSRVTARGHAATVRSRPFWILSTTCGQTGVVPSRSAPDPDHVAQIYARTRRPADHATARLPTEVATRNRSGYRWAWIRRTSLPREGHRPEPMAAYSALRRLLAAGGAMRQTWPRRCPRSRCPGLRQHRHQQRLWPHGAAEAWHPTAQRGSPCSGTTSRRLAATRAAAETMSTPPRGLAHWHWRPRQ